MSICPYIKRDCDSTCGKWVTLTQNMSDKTVKEIGRCADAWMPILMVELRQSIDRVEKKVENLKNLNVLLGTDH